MHTVYLLHCIPNGKNYVGLTCDLRRRIKEHRRGRDSSIGRAVKKYGWARFELQVLASNLFPAEADHLEKLWVIALGSNKRAHGYNVTAGGDSAFKHSEETRRRISATMKERGIAPSSSVREAAHRANTGRRRAPETSAKIRQAKLGRVASPETRAKMSASRKGRKLSAETRARMSEARRRRIQLQPADVTAPPPIIPGGLPAAPIPGGLPQ